MGTFDSETNNFHASRDCDVSALIPNIARIMKKRDGPIYENGLWTATQAHCIFGQGNTCRVLGIKEDPHSFAPRHEKIDPSKSFGKASEFRGVVAARCGS